MIPATFNALKFIQQLKAAGMPAAQAIALSKAQHVMLDDMTNHTLATKDDLRTVREELRDEIIVVKQDILSLRQEVKHDISELRQEFKMDISELRHEIKEDISALKYSQKLNHWMMGFVFTGILCLIAKSFFGG